MYTIEIYSDTSIYPDQTAKTITQARKDIEAYGTLAKRGAIYNKKGKLVGLHIRSTEGNGLKWYKGSIK